MTKIGDAQRKRLAKVHARTPEGLVATDTEIPQEPEFEMGGGGLYGTVGDYLRFAHVFLHDGAFNGGQILQAGNRQAHESERRRRYSCPPAEDGAGADSRTTWISLKECSGGCRSSSTRPQALPTEDARRNSLAWAGLANSYCWIDPAKGVAGVYATQILPFFDVKSVPTFQAFETEVYKAI